MRARLALVVGALLAFVAAAAVVAVVAMARRGPDCPVTMPTADALPQLVGARQLAPSGSVGEQRQPVINAVEGFGPPFGGLVAGRFYDSPTEVPTVVPSGSGLVLATAHPKVGSFEAIDLPSGRPLWARNYAGAASGGRVGDAFVVLAGGPRPAVVSFDAADGTQVGCVAVPTHAGAAHTLLTDQAGSNVVVAAAPLAAPLTLSRIDPSHAVRWHEQLPGVGDAGSVTVSGSSVVVSRVADDPAQLADMAAAGGIAGPTVTAYSLATGSPTWSFPRAADASSTAAAVVGAGPGGGVVVMTAQRGETRSTTGTRVSLVSLDAHGRVAWTVPLGTGYWSAQLVDGLVVAQGADPHGGPMLRAFGARDGRPRWTVRSRQAPIVGSDPRQNFGSVSDVAGTLVAPSPNGLVRIDPATGHVTRLNSQVQIEQVLQVGRVVLLTTEDSLLVLRLS